jgi:hypothetical protein
MLAGAAEAESAATRTLTVYSEGRCSVNIFKTRPIFAPFFTSGLTHPLGNSGFPHLCANTRFPILLLLKAVVAKCPHGGFPFAPCSPKPSIEGAYLK